LTPKPAPVFPLRHHLWRQDSAVSSGSGEKRTLPFDGAARRRAAGERFELVVVGADVAAACRGRAPAAGEAGAGVAVVELGLAWRGAGAGVGDLADRQAAEPGIFADDGAGGIALGDQLAVAGVVEAAAGRRRGRRRVNLVQCHRNLGRNHPRRSRSPVLRIDACGPPRSAAAHTWAGSELKKHEEHIDKPAIAGER